MVPLPPKKIQRVKSKKQNNKCYIFSLLHFVLFPYSPSPLIFQVIESIKKYAKSVKFSLGIQWQMAAIAFFPLWALLQGDGTLTGLLYCKSIVQSY